MSKSNAKFDNFDLSNTSDLPPGMAKDVTKRRSGRPEVAEKYMTLLSSVARPISAQEAVVGLYRVYGHKTTVASARQALRALRDAGKIKQVGRNMFLAA